MSLLIDTFNVYQSSTASNWMGKVTSNNIALYYKMSVGICLISEENPHTKVDFTWERGQIILPREDLLLLMSWASLGAQNLLSDIIRT